MTKFLRSEDAETLAAARSTPVGDCGRLYAHRHNLVRDVTLERELPARFAPRAAAEMESFSFHVSRVRMRTVTREALASMNAQATRATQELADAPVRVPGRADGRGARGSPFPGERPPPQA
jgi:hypothetical protein